MGHIPERRHSSVDPESGAGSTHPNLLARRGVLAGAVGVGALATTVSTPTPRAAADPIDDAVMPVNVKDHGALGDGSTDDSAAFQQAVTAAATSGRSIFVPAGTYAVSTPWTTDAPITIRGEGMWHSVLRVTDGAGFIGLETLPRRLYLEDLAFDSESRDQVTIAIDGSQVIDFTFSRCRFAHSGGVAEERAAVALTHVTSGEFADCLWHNSAASAGRGTGVRVDGPPSGGGRLRFAGNNRFRWLDNGIKIRPNVWEHADFDDTPPTVLQSLDIDGAYFDHFWWLLPAAHAGSGSTVTYTADTLADSDADFSGVNANPRPNYINVRAMPVKRTGSITSATAALLVDDNADFVASEVMRMDVVRSDGRWAVVAVQPWSDANSHTLQIEEWFDDDTLLATTPPAAGSSYTVYGIVVGEAIEKTTTTLTVVDWHDLYGRTVLPAAGTRYEVLPVRPTHQVFVGPGGVLRMSLTNSTLRRGPVDQAAIHAQNTRVIGNHFEDGDEVALVISAGGWSHIVMGNQFKHTGNAAISIQGNESTVLGNRCEGSWWSMEPPEYASDIGLINGRRNIFAYNTSIAGPESLAGVAGCISLRRDTDKPEPWQPNDVTDNVLLYNRRFGHEPDEPDVRLWFRSGDIAGNEIIGSRRIVLRNGSTGQHVEMRGTGSPEGVVAASPGSLFMRTDGSADPLYVKSGGLGATGWSAVGASAPAGPTAVHKATDTVRTDTTSRTADPELTIPVAADTVYQVEVFLIYSSSPAADLGLRWSAPSGATFSWMADSPDANATNGGQTELSRVCYSVGATPRLGGAGASTRIVARPAGTLMVGSSGGDLSLAWAQSTADSSDTVVYAGSWIRLTRLA